jgi:hypothetical protein
MRQMLEVRSYRRIDFAKALYFAAYYNPDNNFFHSYSATFFITKKKWIGNFI